MVYYRDDDNETVLEFHSIKVIITMIVRAFPITHEQNSLQPGLALKRLLSDVSTSGAFQTLVRTSQIRP